MISEAEISNAAYELRAAIAEKVGDLADQILGRPEIGSPEWKAEWDAQQANPERATASSREWHLVKLRICRAADVDMTGNVMNARRFGASWADIGEACGTSRQAAHERWSRFMTAAWMKGAPTPEDDFLPGDAMRFEDGDRFSMPVATEAETVATDVARRCRWAVDHNDGHPNGAWSTGEQLAVALVLADTDHLTSMDYTTEQAMERVAGGMLEPPRNFAKWITNIRATY